MCFKEGLRILKRAYALQRGPTYVLQRESTYFEEGLCALKLGPRYFKVGLCTSQRGPTVFKEGLHTSMGASVLKRVHV